MRATTILSAAVLALAPIFLAAASGAASKGDGPQAAGLTGDQVYRKKCASCHGPNGEGAKDYPEPLVGDRSLEALARYIEKRMPKDAAGTCVGEEAKAVAKFVYDAFYSPAAQARNKPLKVELSRLTVRQFQNAVADLAGAFAPPAAPDPRRGLRGEYFKAGRRFRDDQLVMERLDAAVDFNFGEWSPAEGIYADDFAVRWSGAVFAPESGEYEFTLETENGARLWVNAEDPPLIDVWVRSGDQKKHRASLLLLGGRFYPIRVEIFKTKSDKISSVALIWKRPHRVEELVPEASLTPGRHPEVLVLKTPFPPDDRSMGYERSTSVSKAWDEAATSAALETAAFVAARRDAWAGLRPGASDARARLRDLCRRLAERAFRRPPTPEQQAFFVDRHFEGEADLETAVKKVTLLVLKSPRFLYPEAPGGPPDAYTLASRISFGLWDSLPDRGLLEAARTGRLETREDVAREIERLLPDPRTKAKVREFYDHWLQLDRLHDVSKDPKRFPDFTEAVVSDLRASLDLLLEEVTWGETSDFRQLVLADFVYLNGRLAKLYGAKLPADAPFQKVTLPGQRHAGILTHPLLMAGFAYDATSSPIHRGLFVARSLLGKRLRPPPDAVTPLSPELHPDLTTRERIALQTRPQACQSCHSMINPLGFAFENFDAVGRFRPTEQGKPIDASGSYIEVDGDLVQFNGARELGEYLVRSEETQAAVVEHVFHFFVKQPLRAYGMDRPEILRRDFAKAGFSVRKLMVQVIATSALQGKNR
jgi:mono/diheme cytochrome c family protein